MTEKDISRVPFITDERGEPSLIYTRKGDRFQLCIVDKAPFICPCCDKPIPPRDLVYDLTPDRSLQLARNFLNDGVR